MSSVDSNNP